MYTLSDIIVFTGAKPAGQVSNQQIAHLLTDSRRLLFPDTTLFFAIQTERRDGAQFIDELFGRGVRAFVVDDHYTTPQQLLDTGAVFLRVPNVLTALQQLAIAHREQFQLPVIGITGSNGKTIVKEWLYQLLQPGYTIVRSPRSYNSQTGVPLSVWPLSATDTLGIFEAGISTVGEMDMLEKIIHPAIGVLTNIGAAHDDGFSDRQEKLAAKCRLFVRSAVVICPEALAQQLPLPGTIRRFTWGEGAHADLRITSIEKQETQTLIRVTYQRRELEISIPFTDDAAIANAMTCWSVCCVLQLPQEQIVLRMPGLQHVEMRLELKAGINGCTLINDSYSADLNSLIIALDFLQQQQQHSKRTVILSDIAGSGRGIHTLYTELAAILKQKKIDRLIGVGPAISEQAHCFKHITHTHFFDSTDALIRQFSSLHFSHETILVKGARLFAFEQLVHLLGQKAHQTVLEINLSAIAHNLNVYRESLNPGTRIMAMVKASGYGSGSFEIANLLQFHKADYLAVAYADEGVELRRSGIRLPIMVMNAEEATFDALVAHNLEPELYSFGIYSSFEACLLRSGISNFPVHLKLDTGMHRLGFEPADVDRLGNSLSRANTFKVQTVFSHLAASNDPAHDVFTQQQAALFQEATGRLRQLLPYPFLAHIANTAAISRHPNLQFDMVRLGIGLYGIDAIPHVQQQLNNVTTLKTTVAQLKRVQSGQTVGYNRSGVFTREALIATVRIGYADGYPRSLGNGRGSMLVNGQLAPVAGNVCMDMTMLDVTGIPDIEEGDPVIVFGEGLPVSVLAQQAETIAYEILTGISQRVQRIYFEE